MRFKRKPPDGWSTVFAWLPKQIWEYKEGALVDTGKTAWMKTLLCREVVITCPEDSAHVVVREYAEPVWYY